MKITVLFPGSIYKDEKLWYNEDTITFRPVYESIGKGTNVPVSAFARMFSGAQTVPEELIGIYTAD